MESITLIDLVVSVIVWIAQQVASALILLAHVPLPKTATSEPAAPTALAGP